LLCTDVAMICIAALQCMHVASPYMIYGTVHIYAGVCVFMFAPHTPHQAAEQLESKKGGGGGRGGMCHGLCTY
jgi:hypothetical protein